VQLDYVRSYAGLMVEEVVEGHADHHGSGAELRRGSGVGHLLLASANGNRAWVRATFHFQ
jgi:hypothetical protein